LAFDNSADVGVTLAWLGAMAYMLQLYFDFSGYSDMAIGLGKMMGFTFAENFRYPYISRSITEFWRRWHISLSNWLRDYLYISLGGNRKGSARTYLNLMLVMVLGGLWHGANWTFVLWGLWHGGFLALERATGYDRRASGLTWSLPWTLLCVLIGWVMFRAIDVGQGFEIYAAMLGANGWAGDQALWLDVTRESVALMIIAIFVAWAEPHIAGFLADAPQASLMQRGSGPAAISTTSQLALSSCVLAVGMLTVLKLAEQNFSPFLYFQF
jgi:alginate O-acetyltransferase complex protein AlgI